MQRLRSIGLVILALVFGLLIALVDTRPGWDDTGITVMALLCVSAIFGAINPGRAWLWALAIGLWIPALNILIYQNYGSIMAVAFAFVGAFAGALARKLISDTNRAV